MFRVNLVLLYVVLAFLTVSCSKQITKIACIGDSITEGSGIRYQSKSSYPVMLDSILGAKYSVLNSGKSGTTLHKNGDFPFWNTKEFSNVMAFNPDIIIIKLGTNDSKGQNWKIGHFEADYQSLIDTLKVLNNNPKIFVCLPVPAFETVWGINDSTITKGVIPIVNRIAEKNKLPVIDLYEGLKNYSEYFPDKIHPNEKGAKIMAEIIAKEIINNL
ncbi:GDSL-type esterase/lipase family protein [Mariniflexile aquimaris]|uniref:GDSL-type esterase/lipase family protein n=1 Tax=Mariniflexile aquimaris TaxID=881009 RepID=A0ABW3BQJ4_9FLAO